MPTGLYVHVPFCVKKCSYCSFYSVQYMSGLADEFSKALLQELRTRLKGAEVSTIYVGGGTPTILSHVFWHDFFETLGDVADLSGLKEATIETNPGTAERHEIEEIRKAGFDRLSIGIQSFNDETLAVLDRIHDAETALRCYHEAREAGFRNISIDLMFGVPGQDLQQWTADLGSAVSLRPEHIYCYELTLEEGTPMWEVLQAGKLEKPGDDACVEMYFKAHEILTSQDYVHYEVSNYSHGNSNTSLHNCSYWRRDPYIGLGPSAHSYDGEGTRCWNVHELDLYLKRIREGESPVFGSEELTREQKVIERIMLGLRCCGGVDLNDLMHEKDIEIDYDYIKIMIKHGRVERMGSRLVPTAAGKLFADGDALNLISKSGG